MGFLFKSLALNGLVLVEPAKFSDERGSFAETYKVSDFHRAGLTATFVQDNHSRSTRGVLRGLHYQMPPSAQVKLVRVIAGAIWDVAVDLRPASNTFGKWYGHELNEENGLMIYIPVGFAHGFLTLSDHAHVTYKCSAEYDKDLERGIRWNDPDLAISWPVGEPVISPKDRELPLMRTL